jgi:hypothetical protein
MSEADRDRDARFQQMLEQFMNDLVAVRGVGLEGARMLVREELQRAYDQRVRSRRSNFRVVTNDRQ